MQQPRTTGENNGTGSLVTDPVCGMAIDPVSAKGTADYEGATSSFCSTNCIEKFRAEPARYLRAHAKASLAIQGTRLTLPPAAEYTCPMHPEIRRDKPGSCPKCGMALEPVAPQALGQKVEYTCPMHPEIVREAPGN